MNGHQPKQRVNTNPPNTGTSVQRKDFVEVVRCENCRFLKVINDGKVYARCIQTDFEFLPLGTDIRKHYCGFGERSEK